MHTQSISTSTTPVFLTFRDIAQRVPVSEKTLRNKVAAGTLPFPSALLFGKRVVLLDDFTQYLSDLGLAKAPVPAPAPVSPRKRGRPSKAEQAQARDPRTVDLLTGKADAEVRHA